MILVILLTAIIAGSLGAGICYSILKPKLNQIQESNTAFEIEQETLKANINTLQDQANQFQQLIEQRGEVLQTLIKDIDLKEQEIIRTKEHLNDLTEQQQTAAKTVYEIATQQAQQSYEQEMERLSANLQQRQEDINKAYLSLLADAKEDFENQIADYKNTAINSKQNLELLQQQLEDERNKVSVAVETAKRAQQKEEDDSFYRLKLSLTDQVEIKKLREILPYFRDNVPLNKVIYKCYYEKPYTDLVGRVIGQGQHTGIYKITNVKNQMCYVGQAVNIAERWRQHIKRGTGAEVATRNKLYPVMYEIGPENFTFEILEECTADKLNEREQYWQEFYHAKDWGYSIK